MIVVRESELKRSIISSRTGLEVHVHDRVHMYMDPVNSRQTYSCVRSVLHNPFVLSQIPCGATLLRFPLQHFAHET